MLGAGALGSDQSGAVPSSAAAAVAAATPTHGYSTPVGRRHGASPYRSSPVVTTPEQLQHYLVCLQLALPKMPGIGEGRADTQLHEPNLYIASIYLLLGVRRPNMERR